MSFLVRVIVMLSACLLLPMAGHADPYSVAITAERVQEVPVPKSLKVYYEGIPGPPEQMKAIFSAELERRGYRLDPISGTIVTVRWLGPFGASDKTPRFRPLGGGGSQSRTELGFAITLGRPALKDGGPTYTIGASIASSQGELWKGKVIAVTESRQKSRIMRSMIDRLVGAIGLAILPEQEQGAAIR